MGRAQSHRSRRQGRPRGTTNFASLPRARETGVTTGPNAIPTTGVAPQVHQEEQARHRTVQNPSKFSRSSGVRDHGVEHASSLDRSPFRATWRGVRSNQALDASTATRNDRAPGNAACCDTRTPEEEESDGSCRHKRRAGGSRDDHGQVCGHPRKHKRKYIYALEGQSPEVYATEAVGSCRILPSSVTNPDPRNMAQDAKGKFERRGTTRLASGDQHHD
mmetsp:Transcript_25553/g.60790  ORF Transcript_25553/g.60790 Transcript_25553/m.60790 type:complete len:219 (+) Transcript_25553:870-1526(+)